MRSVAEGRRARPAAAAERVGFLVAERAARAVLAVSCHGHDCRLVERNASCDHVGPVLGDGDAHGARRMCGFVLHRLLCGARPGGFHVSFHGSPRFRCVGGSRRLSIGGGGPASRRGNLCVERREREALPRHGRQRAKAKGYASLPALARAGKVGLLGSPSPHEGGERCGVVCSTSSSMTASSAAAKAAPTARPAGTPSGTTALPSRASFLRQNASPSASTRDSVSSSRPASSTRSAQPGPCANASARLSLHNAANSEGSPPCARWCA